jgi:hypothetical protein
MSGGSVVIKKVKFEEEDNSNSPEEIQFDKTDQWVLNFRYDLYISMDNFLSDSSQDHRFYTLKEDATQDKEIPDIPVAKLMYYVYTVNLLADDKSINSKYGFEFDINRYVNYTNYHRMNLNDKRNLFFLAFALDPRHVAVRFYSKLWLKHFYYNPLEDMITNDKNLVQSIREHKPKRRCLIM